MIDTLSQTCHSHCYPASTLTDNAMVYTTQGKIERFHQTLKQWLTTAGPSTTLDELNTQLNQFTHIYNHERPHRALNRTTPAVAYTALPTAEPTMEAFNQIWRVRHDKVDPDGHATLRYAGKLLHLGIGRAHTGATIIILIHANNTIVINKTTGEIIAEHTIDPTHNYQPKKRLIGQNVLLGVSRCCARFRCGGSLSSSRRWPNG